MINFTMWKISYGWTRDDMARGFQTLVYWSDFLITLDEIQLYKILIEENLVIITQKIKMIENVLNTLSNEINNLKNLSSNLYQETKMIEERVNKVEDSFSNVYKDLMPVSYCGADNWNSYLVQFETIAKTRQWNYEQKGAYLAASLTGKARDLLLQIPSEKTSDYKSLIEILQNSFCIEENEKFNRCSELSNTRNEQIL
ncbi:uncharacterized protein LOC111637222 [Centruroides sculpturatus]|uniref:uncharacterized protein LOC111637222 n=1 Tax=Centruroides sculpturatus TaxID=218467 RepID=UPI000C6CADF3|nr:uncharacterized protein LOC111637222 [Centruroides sculpturatus]